MKKFTKKRVIKIIILIVLIALGVCLGNFAFNKYQRNKFKKILINGDSNIYELIETTNNDVTNVKVMDRVLVSESGDTITWVDGINKKRVILDTKFKTAIITEKDDELEVNSLNHTYIEKYFENSSQKFKYLGKEDDFYRLQFTDKKTKYITILYVSIKDGTVGKVNQIIDGFEFISEFEIKKNSVSKQDVEYPDIDGYHVYDSASTNAPILVGP